MSIAEKLTTIAENEQKVYDAGKQAEYDKFWDSYQLNGERKLYMGAFAGWNPENFNPKYPITPVGTNGARYMFLSFNRIGLPQYMFDMSPFNHMLDFSGATNAMSTFQDANVKNLYCDFSKCVSLQSTFYSANSTWVDNITLKVSSLATTYTNAFYRQAELTEIRFTEDSEIAASISFVYSSKLTDESIQSIIDALGTVTTTKTITFHDTVVNKLTDEQVSQIVNKGWEIG